MRASLLAAVRDVIFGWVGDCSLMNRLFPTSRAGRTFDFYALVSVSDKRDPLEKRTKSSTIAGLAPMIGLWHEARISGAAIAQG